MQNWRPANYTLKSHAKNTEIHYLDGTGTLQKAAKQEADEVTIKSVNPAHTGGGSHPSNLTRQISRACTTLFGERFIAGHMFNERLGGPGNLDSNITAFSHINNMAHHRLIEKPAKQHVHTHGNTITNYYTRVLKRGSFVNTADPKQKALNIATQLEGGYTDPLGAAFKQTFNAGPANHAGWTVSNGSAAPVLSLDTQAWLGQASAQTQLALENYTGGNAFNHRQYDDVDTAIDTAQQLLGRPAGTAFTVDEVVEATLEVFERKQITEQTPRKYHALVTQVRTALDAWVGWSQLNPTDISSLEAHYLLNIP